MSAAIQIQQLYKGYGSGRDEPDWILKDINLRIEQGDICGILGGNGSGKSTLLKILSRITMPSRGQVTGRGKLISLLEAGTSFHPELTGVENIYFNGAMFGESKKDIKKRLQAIIAFAELGHAIDYPTKTYSTGMQIRLAVSIAIHLSPDILILDEILAVADAYFQDKCLGKLKSLNRESGLTILLVSHSNQHLRVLCNTGFVIQQGQASEIMDINTVIRHYEKGISI